MSLHSTRDLLGVALAVLVVGAALVGAVATTTAQSTDQPRLTSDRSVVQGQTVVFDVSAVPNTEESVTLYAVGDSGAEQPVRSLRVENGSVQLAVEGLDPGRYAIVDDEQVLRLTGGVAESAGDVTDESAVERAEFSVVAAENASATLSDDPVTLDGQTARITGETTLLPGTELTVRARSTADAENPFVKSMQPTAQSDGTVTATFDAASLNASTGVQVTILYEGAILAEQTDTLGQQSPPTTATTTQPTDTQTTVPGFGVVVAVLAVLGAGLLAGRR